MTLFSEKLLNWFDLHGRTDLPWQQDRTPYRVWVSEIMLQQTQVTTVIPYYERFMQRFPDIHALANAPADDVMQHWSGLGYYARARNLQKAAQQIETDFGGKFPQRFEDVVSLCGIGPSTAGAILAFCFAQRQAILDGNVKRVLCRQFAVEGYPGEKKIQDRLWQLADSLTPSDRVGDYTQAIMDLGATLCTRSKPLCSTCPVGDSCEALRSGQVTVLPTKKPKKQRPVKHWEIPVIQDSEGRLLLVRRPKSGIWGGLWSLPTKLESDQTDTETWVQKEFGLTAQTAHDLEPIRHGFSHFEVILSPIAMQVKEDTLKIAEGNEQGWFDTSELSILGLPAPIKKLLSELTI